MTAKETEKGPFLFEHVESALRADCFQSHTGLLEDSLLAAVTWVSAESTCCSKQTGKEHVMCILLTCVLSMASQSHEEKKSWSFVAVWQTTRIRQTLSVRSPQYNSYSRRILWVLLNLVFHNPKYALPSTWVLGLLVLRGKHCCYRS